MHGRLALLVAALCAAGCLERRDGAFTAPGRCTSCHGSEARAGTDVRKAAPPWDVDGRADPSSPGVGAHEAHLAASSTHAAVACEECHVVPADVSTPGHTDRRAPAALTFGPIARTGGRSPSYDRATGACTDTYCHAGGTMRWTVPRPSAAACGTCHGLPPHVPSSACERCHAAVVSALGNIAHPEAHVNGNVEVGDLRCDTCHGTAKSYAPPPDVSGSSDTSRIGVGAHQTHLSGGENGRPLACGECHVVPRLASYRDHIDGTADVTFSGVASSWGAAPAWDPASATCSNTWCHGPWPIGASAAPKPSPSWTSGQAIGCAPACHGLPPPAPHLQRTDCVLCHAEVAEGPTAPIVDRTLHVDGKVSLSTTSTCTSCHEDRTSFTGMHALHLSGGTFSSPATCKDCHRAVQNVWDTGHLDGPLVDLTRGFPVTSGPVPTYDARTGRCTSTWCHGAASPPWTTTATGMCSASCHGFPPAAPHPQRTDCALCHANVVEDDDATIKDRTLHVNRVVDYETKSACTDCHKTPNLAPPPDLSGNTSSLFRGVGAHDAHLGSSQFSRTTACSDCHPAVRNVWDEGHLDGKTDVVFSGVATTYGAKPTWDGSSCAGTYCHSRSGALEPNPSWAVPDGTKAVCGGCHSNPPRAGMHPTATPSQCSGCHSEIDTNMNVIDPSRHVDGVVSY